MLLKAWNCNKFYFNWLLNLFSEKMVLISSILIGRFFLLQIDGYWLNQYIEFIIGKIIWTLKCPQTTHVNLVKVQFFILIRKEILFWGWHCLLNTNCLLLYESFLAWKRMLLITYYYNNKLQYTEVKQQLISLLIWYISCSLKVRRIEQVHLVILDNFFKSR